MRKNDFIFPAALPPLIDQNMGRPEQPGCAEAESRGWWECVQQAGCAPHSHPRPPSCQQLPTPGRLLPTDTLFINGRSCSLSPLSTPLARASIASGWSPMGEYAEQSLNLSIRVAPFIVI